MLLRAFGTFIFLLFLSKEYIYVNEEFFVILCFLLFVLVFIIYVSDLVRDTFDSAISEIRTSLFSGVSSYSLSLNETHDRLVKISETLVTGFLLVGGGLLLLPALQQASVKTSSLTKAFLAQSIFSYAGDEAKTTPDFFVVDPFVIEKESQISPEISLESQTHLNVFGNLMANQELAILSLLNLSVAKALV